MANVPSDMEPMGLILAEPGPDRHGVQIDRLRAPHLLPIANKPIALHALDAMASAGITDVVFATSEDAVAPLADAVVRHGSPSGVRVRFAPTDGTGCVVAALLAAERLLAGQPFVAQHADGLLYEELPVMLEAFAREDPDDALLLVQPRSGGGRRIGHVEEARRRAAALESDPRARLPMAGVHIFAAGFLARAGENVRRAAPLADLSRLGAHVVRSSARVSVRRVEGWRRFDGDLKVLLEMNRLILEDLDARPVALAGDSRVEGRVRVHPSARVESSLIRGPAIVGARATIADSFIGPYTAVGEGARVEGAEIDNSIIFPGAVVRHVGARLESCVIGRDARVERCFSVPRAMRVHVGDGASVQLG